MTYVYVVLRSDILGHASSPIGAATSSVKEPRHLTARLNHFALVSSIALPRIVAVMMLLMRCLKALRAMAVRGWTWYLMLRSRWSAVAEI
jgi:hypothetical protein